MLQEGFLFSDSPLWKSPPYMPGEAAMMVSNTVTLRTVMGSHLVYPPDVPLGKAGCEDGMCPAQHGPEGRRKTMSHSIRDIKALFLEMGFPPRLGNAILFLLTSWDLGVKSSRRVDLTLTVV